MSHLAFDLVSLMLLLTMILQTGYYSYRSAPCPLPTHCAVLQRRNDVTFLVITPRCWYRYIEEKGSSSSFVHCITIKRGKIARGMKFHPEK
ncbi:uncharacterized protein EDB91DRAFT_1167177 [Suillus paluster]|uniref:uncharacterized protein n=1 Tax=Suillus paluster TaxID=48578 RepID=UPI001B87B8A6|nr:uncharacterized protein EDB91DRAFT_1167177 [Suillus paluster]KAG1725779.1 hypothetical protein EDB91DRAFT_1167177 [Suillus paluster]